MVPDWQLSESALTEVDVLDLPDVEARGWLAWRCYRPMVDVTSASRTHKTPPPRRNPSKGRREAELQGEAVCDAGKASHSSTALERRVQRLQASVDAHHDAEQSFEAVLETRPADAEARAGLAEVRRRKVDAAKAFFVDAPEPAEMPGAVIGGLTARKVDVLRQFMSRMRRGSQPDVS